MPNQSRRRGVSPVVSVVLLVGVTVILAATVSAFALGVADGVGDVPPLVSESSGELAVQDGFDGGIVRLTHLGGDPVPTDEIVIAVDAEGACGKSGRLVNLPAPGGSPNPTDEYVRGEDVFDNSNGILEGPIGEAGGVWEAGETVSFRLASSECALDRGEEITVSVIHTATESIVMDETLRVS